MIQTISIYSHEDKIVGIWVRTGKDQWTVNGPSHETLSTDSLFDRLRNALTCQPPPTPEERAIKLHKEIISETGITFSPKIENWIANEIQAAINADRETR